MKSILALGAAFAIVLALSAWIDDRHPSEIVQAQERTQPRLLRLVDRSMQLLDEMQSAQIELEIHAPTAGLRVPIRQMTLMQSPQRVYSTLEIAGSPAEVLIAGARTCVRDGSSWMQIPTNPLATTLPRSATPEHLERLEDERIDGVTVVRLRGVITAEKLREALKNDNQTDISGPISVNYLIDKKSAVVRRIELAYRVVVRGMEVPTLMTIAYSRINEAVSLPAHVPETCLPPSRVF